MASHSFLLNAGELVEGSSGVYSKRIYVKFRLQRKLAMWKLIMLEMFFLQIVLRNLADMLTVPGEHNINKPFNFIRATKLIV